MSNQAVVAKSMLAPRPSSQESIRVIVTHLGAPMSDQILRTILKRFSVESCISVCQIKCHVPFVGADRQLWIPSTLVKWGEYDTDWDEITPIGADLVENMRHCESVYMDMLTRLEERQTLSYQVRKRAYLKSLQYWNHILDTWKINLYLSSGIPHESHDYIIYSLCKFKGVPTIFVHAGAVKEEHCVLEDWEESAAQIPDVLKRLREEYADPHKMIVLNDKYTRFLEAQVASSRTAPVPWDMENSFSGPLTKKVQRIASVYKRGVGNFMNHVWRFYVRLCHPKHWIASLDRMRRVLLVRRMVRFYDQHAVEPDLTKPFVYFPLQMQPECSTTPMAGAFTDQILIAKMLSGLLPDEVLLYIKEHPNQSRQYPDGRGRELFFYKDLLDLNRVRFVSRGYNSFDLLTHCMAVATGTGTVGMEALFKEKPVLLFGHTFTQYASGVFQVDSVESCRKALRAIFENGAKPTIRESALFLRALQEVSVPGVFDREYKKESSDMTFDESVASMSSAYIERIRKYFPESAHS
ncbi:hypothetical protein HYZ98_04310 [Candidatus Peregrinibacteria bacterium]|nr:hypothetical protein [Candidatus Peregrinibacteria bacterium]